MDYEKIRDALATAYEHYLMRDLVYVSSGALLIITLYYAIYALPTSFRGLRN